MNLVQDPKKMTSLELKQQFFKIDLRRLAKYKFEKNNYVLDHLTFLADNGEAKSPGCPESFKTKQLAGFDIKKIKKEKRKSIVKKLKKQGIEIDYHSSQDSQEEDEPNNDM